MEEEPLLTWVRILPKRVLYLERLLQEKESCVRAEISVEHFFDSEELLMAPENAYFFNGHATIADAIQSGHGPDVFELPDWMVPRYAALGLLDEIPEEILQRWKNNTLQDFHSCLKLAEFDGKYYGLPVECSSIFIVYNSKEDEQFNPAVLNRWDAILTEGYQHSRKQSLILFPSGASSERFHEPFKWYWYPMFRQFHGALFDVSGKRCRIDTIEMRQTFEQIRLITTMSGDVKLDDPSYLSAYVSGNSRAGMATLQTLSYCPNLVPHTRMLPFPPVNDNHENKVIQFGHVFVVNKYSDRTEQAWQLVSMLSESMDCLKMKCGNANPRLIELENYNSGLSEVITQISHAECLPRHPELRAVAEVVQSALLDYLLKECDLDSVLKSAQQKADHILQR